LASGDARRRGAAAAALAALAVAAIAGCGEGEGVAAGASVHVYVAAELCPGAREALGAGAREALGGGEARAGDVRVRALCLAPVVSAGAGGAGGRIDLAAQGANARRASEDTTAVAFLEARGKPARFARPIVEAAGIAFVEAGDGAAAMERIVAAIEAAGTSGALRTRVRDALE
jgi:hypothetical protein